MAKTASNENAQPGHNSGSMTNDQRQALALMHRRIYRAKMAVKKEADAAVRNACKVLKADLGENGLLQIKTMIAMETPEGEAKIRAEMQAKSEAVSWSSTPDGQFDMFPAKAPTGETQAFMKGKIAGMDDEALNNPFGAGTSDAEDYARGWHLGKSVMDELIADREQAAATAEVIKGSDEGGDLDDEDSGEEAA